MNPERIGPWRILEKLGSGGMGHVYLGVNDSDGSQAAIKVLTASLAREGGFVERFNREIASMRKLDSPHIVKLYDSGVDGENYYYAMEYVPGETLLELMRREKRLPWKRAVEFSIQVCRALKSAHDAGIIHRDLKPSNLLLTNDGFIKLTDFGVAQVFAGGRLTVTGGIIGTAEYMSPEQAQGKRATRQSDLYALGALMYAMVTGRTPFSGSTAVEVIQKHKFGLFDKPSLYTPELPRRVEETICKLLEKDPAKRYPDAFVLMRHLEQLLRMEQVLQADDYISTGVTLADSSAGSGEAPTAAVTVADSGPAHPESARAGPATLMQGLMRAEIEELNRGHWLTGVFNTLFVQVTLLVLVVAGGVWWMWPREVAPERRFEQGVELLQKKPGTEWLRARREFFEPLVAADPDTWSDKVAPYLLEIELYELTRPTRGGERAKSTATAANLEAERWLRLAQHYREMGDFSRAERILTSLQSMLAGNADEAKMYQLAGRLLAELQRQQRQAADRDRLLQAAAERAAALSAAGNSSGARDIWQGIVDLYADEPAARSFVDKAREGLREPERRE